MVDFRPGWHRQDRRGAAVAADDHPAVFLYYQQHRVDKRWLQTNLPRTDDIDTRSRPQRTHTHSYTDGYSWSSYNASRRRRKRKRWRWNTNNDFMLFLTNQLASGGHNGTPSLANTNWSADRLVIVKQLPKEKIKDDLSHPVDLSGVLRISHLLSGSLWGPTCWPLPTPYFTLVFGAVLFLYTLSIRIWMV